MLSACETGRGETTAGEGVLGLSRALSIAGARGFLLSLWAVPDDATHELMDACYEGLWSAATAGPATRTAEQAPREAQLRLLAADRAAGVFRPRRWGAWILLR